MSFRVCASVLAAVVLLPTVAAADSLPPIKISPSNAVPECVTPGRLMAFLKDRNPRLNSDLEKIAVEYMRHGEALGLRWDYAFFQMVIETGYLTFERSKGRRGDVRPTQNNFAGLGAAGRGQNGESFPDVSTGVLAHLQHVLMYTGEPIAEPVAERTRKVIEWRVLDNWRARLRGPMTYSQLAQKWANGDSYAHAIAKHAEIFFEHFCNTPDPAPELLAEARPTSSTAKQAVAATRETERTPPAVNGRELAQRAIDAARSDVRRSSLGGPGLGALARDADPATSTVPAETAVLPMTPKANAPTTGTQQGEPGSPFSPLMQAASTVGSMLKGMAEPQPPAPPAPSASLKCRVWTASYGGTKAILIKAQTPEGLSYTVLDVNEGAEKREAAAYIAAYAKGGEIDGWFGSQTQALEKAFELCPEG